MSALDPNRGYDVWVCDDCGNSDAYRHVPDDRRDPRRIPRCLSTSCSRRKPRMRQIIRDARENMA